MFEPGRVHSSNTAEGEHGRGSTRPGEERAREDTIEGGAAAVEEGHVRVVRRDDNSIVATAGEGGGVGIEVRNSTGILLLALFVAHYINRAVIYPLRMSPRSQRVPLVVTMSAMLSTSLNGYLQARYLCSFNRFPPLEEQVTHPRFLFGIAIFFAGFLLNVQSDGILRNLRKSDGNEKKDDGRGTTQREYYIPRGGMFDFCSCPNFLGEIVEWVGFAVASGWSLPSVAFAVFTASNLVPRALAHHEWYKRNFDDYPPERTAIVPFLL